MTKQDLFNTALMGNDQQRDVGDVTFRGSPAVADWNEKTVTTEDEVK